MNRALAHEDRSPLSANDMDLGTEPMTEAPGALPTSMPAAEEGNQAAVQTIWGTSIKVHHALNLFRDFIDDFCLGHVKQKQQFEQAKRERAARLAAAPPLFGLVDHTDEPLYAPTFDDMRLSDADREPYYPSQIRRVPLFLLYWRFRHWLTSLSRLSSWTKKT